MGRVMKNLTGLKFGRLTVVEQAGKASNGAYLWRCLCVCGQEKIVEGAMLTAGHTQSCGCLKHEMTKKMGALIVHGDARPGKYQRLYYIWNNIRHRCQNPNAKAYPSYGGRGITISSEWNDYQNFKRWAVSTGYDPDAPARAQTIARIDINKGFSPDNCRWILRKQKHPEVLTRNMPQEEQRGP